MDKGGGSVDSVSFSVSGYVRVNGDVAIGRWALEGCDVTRGRTSARRARGGAKGERNFHTYHGGKLPQEEQEQDRHGQRQEDPVLNLAVQDEIGGVRACRPHFKVFDF